MSTGFTETRAEENTEMASDFAPQVSERKFTTLKRTEPPSPKFTVRTAPTFAVWVCVDDGAKVMLEAPRGASREGRRGRAI